jgi:hypothetical protein
MSSKKQFEANRNNAKSSTGPKTRIGKKNIRHNALKHGFYAREMIIRPENKTEIDTLQGGLYSQLLPKTALQKLAFKEVVHCAWQCELAARLDMRCVNGVLFPPDAQESSPDRDLSPIMNFCFAASPEDLRKRLRFLDRLQLEVERCGGVPEEWKDSVLKGFGPGFLDLLDQPKSPISIDALLLANHLCEHAKTFGKPLPPRTGEGPEVIVDPQQTVQSTLKLIELMKEFLNHLRRINRGAREEAIRISADDSPPRHFASATRALHRAIAWYQYLVRNGL